MPGCFVCRCPSGRVVFIPVGHGVFMSAVERIRTHGISWLAAILRRAPPVAANEATLPVFPPDLRRGERTPFFPTGTRQPGFLPPMTQFIDSAAQIY